jgi:hypothetical protein
MTILACGCGLSATFRKPSFDGTVLRKTGLRRIYKHRPAKEASSHPPAGGRCVQWIYRVREVPGTMNSLDSQRQSGCSSRSSLTRATTASASCCTGPQAAARRQLQSHRTGPQLLEGV